MKCIAETISEDLMKEKSALGVLLVGSLVTGEIHEESDIDLIVVYDVPKGDCPPRKESKIGDFIVEIHPQPVEYFIHTFDDDKYRNKGGAWFSANFCYQMLYESKILQDPIGKLHEWKKKAINWIWRDSEIQPLFDHTRKYLSMSRDKLEVGDLFASLVVLRDSFTRVASATMMKEGMPSCWRPKDQSIKIPLLQKKHPRLVELFYDINDLRKIPFQWLLSHITELEKIIKAELGCLGIWDGALIHLKAAKGCLRRNNYPGTLLCTRMATYRLGIQVLNKEGLKIPLHVHYPPTHLRVIEELFRLKPRLHGFYADAHRVNLWDSNRLKRAQQSLRNLIEQMN